MRWHGTRWTASSTLYRKPLGVHLKVTYPSNPQRINTHRVFCRPFLVVSAFQPCNTGGCVGVEAVRGDFACA